jgi:hypothetical protein
VGQHHGQHADALDERELIDEERARLRLRSREIGLREALGRSCELLG